AWLRTELPDGSIRGANCQHRYPDPHDREPGPTGGAVALVEEHLQAIAGDDASASSRLGRSRSDPRREGESTAGSRPTRSHGALARDPYSERSLPGRRHRGVRRLRRRPRPRLHPPLPVHVVGVLSLDGRPTPGARPEPGRVRGTAQSPAVATQAAFRRGPGQSSVRHPDSVGARQTSQGRTGASPVRSPRRRRPPSLRGDRSPGGRRSAISHRARQAVRHRQGRRDSHYPPPPGGSRGDRPLPGIAEGTDRSLPADRPSRRPAPRGAADAQGGRPSRAGLVPPRRGRSPGRGPGPLAATYVRHPARGTVRFGSRGPAAARPFGHGHHTGLHRGCGPRHRRDRHGQPRSPDAGWALIRSFRSEDTEGVVALWQAAGLVRPWNDPHEAIASQSGMGDEWFLLAEAGSQVGGSVMAGVDGHRGWLYYLAVLPDHQGSGLGRALVEEAEGRLASLGCPKVNLQIRSDNTEVAAFY